MALYVVVIFRAAAIISEQAKELRSKIVESIVAKGGEDEVCGGEEKEG